MTAPSPPSPSPWRPRRRELVLGAAGAAAAAAAVWSRRLRGGSPAPPAADPLAVRLGDEKGQRAAVYLARARSYDEDLSQPILEGLAALGIDRTRVRGKKVLLKPNLVETRADAPHINTHPAVVRGAAEAFRRLDAAAVVVAEGQGHRRDSELVLAESGLRDVLERERLPYTDLNHDDLCARPNRCGLTGLPRLVLPRRLAWADFKVSLAKMKTHHWVGCTLSLKNLFGVLPGVHYGWPKNVLHQRGIEQSIVDIAHTVDFDLAIVDGIVGMEGDGPIMGTPKPVGVLALGARLASVDATCARIMGLRVSALRYLLASSAAGLGPIRAEHIEQRGVAVADVASSFALLDAPHLRRYRG